MKKATTNIYYYHSPIGCIKIVASVEQILSLSFVEINKDNQKITNLVVSQCVQQLKQYFAQKLQKFNLPLAIKGTTFQELVWSETFKIPYGTTISYQTLANKINKPKAVRAVGNALAKNPLAIIIPCHRVIRTNKPNIVNYFWRKERKIFLQNLESSFLATISLDKAKNDLI